jgi:hypothetical protein
VECNSLLDRERNRSDLAVLPSLLLLTFGSWCCSFFVSHDVFELFSILVLFSLEFFQRVAQHVSAFVECFDHILAVFFLDRFDGAKNQLLSDSLEHTSEIFYVIELT